MVNEQSENKQSKVNFTIGRILIGIVALVVIGYNAYKFFQGEPLGFSDLISIPLILMFFFNSMTWNSKEEEKDELGQMITYKSTKISYFSLMVFIFIIFLVVEFPASGNQSIKNMPLFIVLCVSTLILPFTEFLVARKYR